MPMHYALINKKLKQTTLQSVLQFSNTINRLYTFNNMVLLNLDINGYINYYADTHSIYDNISFIKYLQDSKEVTYSDINNTNTLNNNTTIEQILLLYNYIHVNININNSSYNSSYNSSTLTPTHTHTPTHIPITLIDNTNIKYYISKYTYNLNVLKLDVLNNTIKILRPIPLVFPIYINSITSDEYNNIILSGKINDSTSIMNITYTKSFTNPIIYITP